MTRERSAWARRSLSATRVGRLRGIALLAACGYLAVFVRAVQVHLFPDPRLQPLLAQRSQKVEREKLRGSIVDREGRALVARGDVDSLQAFPADIPDKVETARLLAPVLRTSEQSLLRLFRRDGGSVYVRRWLDGEVAARIAALDLAGIALVPERRGKYPSGPLAAALLGFAGYDEVAWEGLELLFDDVLSPVAAQSPPAAGEDGAIPEPVRGATVQLALDARLQHEAEQALEEGLARTGARHGSLVALDPHSGDILVAAEAPGFDPYAFRKADPTRFRLRAFVDAYEPGSTIKPFTVAAALESGVLVPDDVFYGEQGRWVVGGFPITDLHPHGDISVTDCLRRSSNICLGKIAERLGSRRLVHWLRRFGFGEPVPTDFPGTTRGVVHDLGQEQALERTTLSFGQGMQASALQLALAGAVLANGGQRVAPRLALAILRGSEREEIAPQLGPRVVSERTTRELRRMMERVVLDGTGKAAALPFHRVAGKTGTAQKSMPGTEGYSEDKMVASFLGIVPVADPRLVVVVMLDEPERPNHQGGVAAAPVFQRFARYAMNRLSVPRDAVLVAQWRESRREAGGTAPPDLLAQDPDADRRDPGSE